MPSPAVSRPPRRPPALHTLLQRRDKRVNGKRLEPLLTPQCMLNDVGFTPMRLAMSNALAGRRGLMCNGCQGCKVADANSAAKGDSMRSATRETTAGAASSGCSARSCLISNPASQETHHARLHKGALHELPLKLFFSLPRNCFVSRHATTSAQRTPSRGRV